MVGNVTSLPSFIATPATRATETGKSSSTETAQTESRRDDAVRADVSRSEYRQDVSASREDVAAARSALDMFIAVAKQARSLLLEARDVASKSADAETPDAARAAQDVSFKALVQELGQLVDGAVRNGADALSGGVIAADADPDANRDLEISGLDLRVKAASGEDDAVRLTTASNILTAEDAAAAAKAADESIRRIDEGLRRIETGASRLDAHTTLLAQLDSALASQVRVDFDADAARLIALQVRQDLSRANAPIANVAPSQVLALFRE